MKLRVYVCKSLGILVTSGSPVSHGVWKNPAVLGCVSIMTLHHTWFPWAHFSPPVNQLCARPPKWQPHLPFSSLQPKSLIPFLPAAKRGSEGNPYFLLPIHFTCWQGNAQSFPGQASIVHVPRTFRCTSWIQERQRNQRSNCQHLLDHRKSKEIPEKHVLLLQ